MFESGHDFRSMLTRWESSVLMTSTGSVGSIFSRRLMWAISEYGTSAHLSKTCFGNFPCNGRYGTKISASSASSSVPPCKLLKKDEPNRKISSLRSMTCFRSEGPKWMPPRSKSCLNIAAVRFCSVVRELNTVGLDISRIRVSYCGWSSKNKVRSGSDTVEKPRTQLTRLDTHQFSVWVELWNEIGEYGMRFISCLTPTCVRMSVSTQFSRVNYFAKNVTHSIQQINDLGVDCRCILHAIYLRSFKFRVDRHTKAGMRYIWMKYIAQQLASAWNAPDGG